MTPHIYIDADACPVREETYKVARRHGVPVTDQAESKSRLFRDTDITIGNDGDGGPVTPRDFISFLANRTSICVDINMERHKRR